MRWFLRGAVAVVVLLVLALAYGTLVEPRLVLDEERLEVALPGLPDEATGTEIAVLSDFQVGMWWANTGMVERAVATVVEEQPDAVLLAGDFVYSESPDVGAQVDTVLELLRPLLDSGIPVFAVMGNHDHLVGAVDELTEVLEDAGAAVLVNRAARLEVGGAELHVVGLGSAQGDRVDVDAALADVPEGAPRVVVMHNPTTFSELPAGAAPFAVAGHTHCGQIALPGRPEWSYLALTEEEEIVADGWAPDGYGADGNALYVTCGIGFSVVPVRLNAPPQLLLVELQPAP